MYAIISKNQVVIIYLFFYILLEYRLRWVNERSKPIFWQVTALTTTLLPVATFTLCILRRISWSRWCSESFAPGEPIAGGLGHWGQCSWLKILLGKVSSWKPFLWGSGQALGVHKAFPGHSRDMRCSWTNMASEERAIMLKSVALHSGSASW